MKLSKEQYLEIVEMSKIGYNFKQIAEMYSISMTRVWQIVHNNGVGGTNVRLLDIPYDDIKDMHEMYCDGMSTEEIGAKYHISRESVYNLFERNGFDRKRDPHRIYSIDENYFDNINTRNKAYILGLFWADGCNKVSENEVEISLQEEDKHILESIKQELKYDKLLNFRNISKNNPKRKNQWHLSITSNHISQTLNDIGMVQNKSLVVEFPKNIDEKLYPDFIRGVLDGDGCVYIGGNIRGSSVEIVGTVMVVQKIAEIVKDTLGVHCSIKSNKRWKDITKAIRIRGRYQIKTFLDWIYSDAELKLNRKYNKYQQFLNMYNNINNSYLV